MALPHATRGIGNEMHYKTYTSGSRSGFRSEVYLYKEKSTKYNEGMKNMNYEWRTMIWYMKSLGGEGGILKGFDPPFMTAKDAEGFLNSEKNRKVYTDTIRKRGQERKMEELGKGEVTIEYINGDGEVCSETFNR